MKKQKIGFAITGSFCTFKQAETTITSLVEAGFEVVPIMSFNASSINTRFGNAKDWIEIFEGITKNKVINSIEGAEPIGPKKLVDAIIIAPCTGNTLAKIAVGITDTPVTMAAKSLLRNSLPLVIAVSTNDGLSSSAKNIGVLLNRKNIYFVPFNQDDPTGKPRSLVADFSKIPQTLEYSFIGQQIQPLILF